MNLIDHRILIPTSPERVWHFVGDLRRNTEWQVNCRSISTLTSTPKPQPGTRLRVTPDRGREWVIEITAWYERFGYEYRVVEGTGFRDNKGTLRLQEVPEGTIVQWTFSYKSAGLFGGGTARNQEAVIIDSLRGLYRLITKSNEVETFQAKSLMRDDPGVEARATYRPRHPYGDTAEGSAGRVKGSRQPGKPQPVVTLSEPPIKPDDTKPRPVVVDAPLRDTPATSPAAAAQPVSPFTEPDFLIDESSPPYTDVPSEPIEHVSGTPPPMPAVEIPHVPPSSFDAPPPVETTPAPELIPVEPVEPAMPSVVAEPKPVAESAPAAPAKPSVLPIKPSSAPRRDKLTDTSRISVFEVFGLPKPSETQEVEPMSESSIDPQAAVQSMPDHPPAPRLDRHVTEARHFGRRALMRGKLVKLRLHT